MELNIIGGPPGVIVTEPSPVRFHLLSPICKYAYDSRRVSERLFIIALNGTFSPMDILPFGSSTDATMPALREYLDVSERLYPLISSMEAARASLSILFVRGESPSSLPVSNSLQDSLGLLKISFNLERIIRRSLASLTAFL